MCCESLNHWIAFKTKEDSPTLPSNSDHFWKLLLHVVNVFRTLLIVITFSKNNIASTFLKVSSHQPSLLSNPHHTKCGWLYWKTCYFQQLDYRSVAIMSKGKSVNNWTNPLLLHWFSTIGHKWRIIGQIEWWTSCKRSQDEIQRLLKSCST